MKEMGKENEIAQERERGIQKDAVVAVGERDEESV